MFSSQSLMRKLKKTKRLLLAQKGQIFFQRKGFNLDILLIEQVILVYNAVNNLPLLIKKIYIKIYLLRSHNQLLILPLQAKDPQSSCVWCIRLTSGWHIIKHGRPRNGLE